MTTTQKIVIASVSLIGAYFIYNKYVKKKSANKQTEEKATVDEKNIRIITQEDIEEIPIKPLVEKKMFVPNIVKGGNRTGRQYSISDGIGGAQSGSLPNFLRADGYYNANSEGYAQVNTEGFF